MSVEVVNKENNSIEKDILFTVSSDASGKKIASHKVKKNLEIDLNKFSFEMTLNRAELWTPETPNLYNMGADIGGDRKNVRFGVRTFAVKLGESGGHNYYLNGKRFIFRSAIDWGFYTPTGDYATPELAEANSSTDIIVIGSLDVASFIGSEPYIKEWWHITPIFDRVKRGATLILRFDEQWADVLHYTEILSEKVTEWGGNQTRWWFGNGWGYLDHFVGYDSTASSGTIGTTSWEVSGDPVGFYPFVSDYNITAHGFICVVRGLAELHRSAIDDARYSLHLL